MIRTDNACRPDRLDPASLSTLSGLEIVNGLADGRLPHPPMAETLPFTLYPPSAGRVELSAVPETRFLNPMGIVHGGWAMTMLDSAMGLSALTTLSPTSSCLIVGIPAQARAPQPSAVAKLSRRDAATVAMVNLIP